MGMQYFSNKGIHKKKKVLSLKHSYHGDTYKTMEVGDDSDYHFAFDKKDNVIHIDTNIKALETAFENNHQDIALMIVEPLLQGAGGMRMYDVSFLERARTLCDQYDVLLIFDEVATGFGRTGHMFVSDLVCPDIVVLGKALTGGYIGHAATVTNKKVFDAFYTDNPDHAFMHGPTFMGNALACSVALKSLEIFERENYMEKVKKIEAVTRAYFKNFSHPLVKDVRMMGAVLCIEVHDASSLNGFKEFAYERGVFNRPFLNYLYTCVPFIITEEELIQIFNVLTAWFQEKH
jgi:adenosylmethionine-8-amino-7-oxononanoate aminotransferase